MTVPTNIVDLEREGLPLGIAEARRAEVDGEKAGAWQPLSDLHRVPAGAA